MKMLKEMFSTEKKVSSLQMSLTIIQVFALVLSSILVVKTIDLFGLPWLANSCAILTFPITYTLSDVFSEVYGYKWSRVTGTWAAIGTALFSIVFMIAIKINGNAAWENQEAMVSILGNTPKVAFASVLAFWLGDLINDKVFEVMRRKSSKWLALRAILSSLCGKYVDGIVFTFIGLSFLPMNVKIVMVLNCPFVQIGIETLLLPTTYAISKALKAIEE